MAGVPNHDAPAAAGRWDVVDGRPDFAAVYTVCPVCGAVGTSSGSTYTLTPAGGLDLDRAIELACCLLWHRYTARAMAILPRDTTITCRRPVVAGRSRRRPAPTRWSARRAGYTSTGPARRGDSVRASAHREAYVVHMDGVRAELRARRDRVDAGADSDGVAGSLAEYLVE